MDECSENPRICLNGRCENTPGSFECVCANGFTGSAVGPFCVDMDECAETGMCSNGKCINMDGSFKCVCDSGYKLSPDGKNCIGILNILIRFIYSDLTHNPIRDKCKNQINIYFSDIDVTLIFTSLIAEMN